MKKALFFIAALAAASFDLSAQQTTDRQYLERYNSLVSAVGMSGVGVETLVDKWIAAYPEDTKAYQGKFFYYYNKSQSSSVVSKPEKKYLGQEPILSLKDSLGNDVNYFQVAEYNDELFGLSVKEIDKAIRLSPNALDLRATKISALVDYEKTSPDMASGELKALIDYNGLQKPKWTYADSTVTSDFFDAMVQEYCYAFFRYASPSCYEVFRELSEKMLKYEPDNVLFLNNVGTYWLVAKKDSKNALKYYNLVLKKHPDDQTALKNCIILARNDKNVKLEKKYLAQLVKYAPDEITKKSTQLRLDALN